MIPIYIGIAHRFDCIKGMTERSILANTPLKPELLETKLCGWAPTVLLIPEKYKDEFWGNGEYKVRVIPSLMPHHIIAYY